MTRKPRLVLHITIVEPGHWSSWNVYILRGKKEEVRLSESKLALDEEIASLIQTFETLGAEIEVSRCKAGMWTTDKPIRWYKRFKALLA